MTYEQIVTILLNVSKEFERGMRRLNPFALFDIRKELLSHLKELEEVKQFLIESDMATTEKGTSRELLRACDLMLGAVRNFASEDDLRAAYISALRAARRHCRMKEALYPLKDTYSEVNRYFLEPGATATLPSTSKMSLNETGISHEGVSAHPHSRGGYSLYLPENYTTESAWPMVVALHGGYSHGRDFLWTWLREARTRGLVLFAPTSQAMTWSITHVGDDGKLLAAHLHDLFSRVHIDRSRILLTGMSDGGTFALGLAFSGMIACDAIAPVSCALPPVDLQNAKGKRIFWVHGAQDWIFPAGSAVQACRRLQQAGADIKLKMIEDLSHTYPCEANDAILNWFGIGKRGGNAPS
jgi:phospholipase/carboxylesterase